jgi:hypothetical protein
MKNGGASMHHDQVAEKATCCTGHGWPVRKSSMKMLDLARAVADRDCEKVQERTFSAICQGRSDQSDLP